ncbi:hypothetical protein BMI86_10235 [Thioclava sp. DLFJ5-1]|uniref:hypothetical protein n=1 Tax=Thioclava sp. DLFJ5-1 TaxID=1915314 RepID=UPI0009969CC8|nr:hypothetical protein [Thioclava sp. DLFJ5-1]OOY20875.1 hypothetical protein BMI86_10235 [Thioclava sp. DLFJ5-1]
MSIHPMPIPTEPLTQPLPMPHTEAEWAEALADPIWRLCSGCLYKIMVKTSDDDDGQVFVKPFLPNVNQLKFLREMHTRNVILKARQLGFTTFACILGLDQALFVGNQRCGIVAQTVDVAADMLRDKVKFAWLNLPEPLRLKMPLKRESAKELLFGHNNSSIRVATSMRGSTIHYLHISEMGKIAKQYPERAKEIVTGSLPAVPKTAIATIESTAEGTSGEFYNIASKAEALAQAQHRAFPGQFQFHFFPWFQDPGYVADPTTTAISATQHAYFNKLEGELGIKLPPEKRAWYVVQLENDFSGDMHKMRQEMPSSSAEAWSRSTEGTYLTPQLVGARKSGRIGKVPYQESLPVYTFWDIGAGDGTAIWLMQQVGMASHFIGFIEGWGEGYSYYVNKLAETGYVFANHHLPHDANQIRQMQSSVGSPLMMLQELRRDWSFVVVPRVHDFQAGLTMLRQKFSEAWFDEEGCKEGLTHLALYHKKFNTRLGTYIDSPEKDEGDSEAPDALRQWAQGFVPLRASRGSGGNTQPSPTAASRRRRRRRTGMTA